MSLGPAREPRRRLKRFEFVIDDSRKLIRVNESGIGGTQVFSFELKEDGTHGKGVVLIDLPGRRSHEYFPRLSPKGDYLVWGATQRGQLPFREGEVSDDRGIRRQHQNQAGARKHHWQGQAGRAAEVMLETIPVPRARGRERRWGRRLVIRRGRFASHLYWGSDMRRLRAY
jgi:hypothetical protein